jgi:hypothetical protein
MKKISTCMCCVLIFSYASHAQFAKGSKLIGGNFSVFSTAHTLDGIENKYTSISIAPSIGKFYKQNRMFGVSVSVSTTFRKDRADDYGYGAGIFLRQYKPLAKSAFLLFIEENASASRERSKQFTWGSNDFYQQYSYHRIALGISPGLAYSLSRNLQLEASIPSFLLFHYQAMKTKGVGSSSPEEKNNSFVFSSGLSSTALGDLSVGVRWLIP